MEGILGDLQVTCVQDGSGRMGERAGPFFTEEWDGMAGVHASFQWSVYSFHTIQICSVS